MLGLLSFGASGLVSVGSWFNASEFMSVGWQPDNWFITG